MIWVVMRMRIPSIVKRIMKIWIRYIKLIFFGKKKKEPTLPEQDINMKTKLECRIQEAYQYADALKNQMTTYDDPKWIKFILSSSHLNSITCNICTYLTATQTHEKHSSHTHPQNQKECLSQSFTLFHHC